MNPFMPDEKVEFPRKMKLFVAGDGVNSARARKNLAQVCEERLKGQYELEVINVLEDFQTALMFNVVVTPALVVTEPQPRVTVLGDLSNTSKLLDALRLN